MFKFVVLFTLTLVAIAQATKEPCTGCVEPLEGDSIKEAEEALTLSLTKLTAGDGPHYKLGKINKASSQIVSGVLYRINAELIDGEGKTKICDVRIHSQAWLKNGIEITFECPGEESVTKKHSA